MLDAQDVRWLLIAVASVSAIVVLLGSYGNHLERRYVRELQPPGEDIHPDGDELPVRYHAQALAQAWVSYYVSLFFIGLAFILVVGADNGRGLAAVVTVVLAVIFFVESRKSRASMLEQARAHRAEDDDRRRDEERLRLIEMVSEGEARDRLVRKLMLRLEPSEAEPVVARPAPTYVTTE